MKLRKLRVVLLALLLAAMAMVPMVSAADEDRNKANIVGETVPAPKTMDINLIVSRQSQESDNGFIITNPATYLTFWNEKLNWGLSRQQIDDTAKKMETRYLKKYRSESGNSYEIHDLEELSNDLQQAIGITKEQGAVFVIAQKEQIRIDHKNFYDPSKSLFSLQRKSGAGILASPATQSAPSATGDLYTAIIFTDFQTPGEEGLWRESHKEDAYYDAYVGTNRIENQADSRAGVENSLGYYTVTVSGENTGDNSGAWGRLGWMERAAQNLGYADINVDGRYTDDMARALEPRPVRIRSHLCSLPMMHSAHMRLVRIRDLQTRQEFLIGL